MRTAADNLAPTFGREVRQRADRRRPAVGARPAACTTSVLTMELLRGQSLLREQRRRLQSMAAAEGRDANELEVRAKASGRAQGADAARARNLGVRDLPGRARRVRERAYWHAQCRVCCCGREVSRTWLEPPRPCRGWSTRCSAPTPTQLFDDGFFRGAPTRTPGNILLRDDGRVGLPTGGR